MSSYLLSFFALLLAVGGCASLPSPLPGGVASGDVAVRYQSDQALRRTGFLTEGWRVEGTLEMDTPKILRRNRMELWGRGVTWARLVLFGPFRDVAGELHLTREWIRLSDPGKRDVVEVPASAEGMQYLTGLSLEPGLLLALLQARAEAATVLPPGEDGGVWADTPTGERLLLVPDSGRILERHGLAPDGTAFMVQYLWGAPVTQGVLLPEKISIHLGDDALFVVRARQWEASDPAEQVAESDAIPPGFSLRRPLD
ncbi:MAG: hypothetical protein HQL63_04875 [Magnetococcales bacterium]|nr:hypothetical protein [Magnetococcales bacterium]